ncbi:MAG: DUF5723 family protein [Treponema sp.]|jgi:hypothetical protein|nr:DUF5723 family protein [Treponema sp.]
MIKKLAAVSILISLVLTGPVFAQEAEPAVEPAAATEVAAPEEPAVVDEEVFGEPVASGEIVEEEVNQEQLEVIAPTVTSYQQPNVIEPVPFQTYDVPHRGFELGLVSPINLGLANGIINFNDIFKKQIVIDLQELGDSISEKGGGINFNTKSSILYFNFNQQENLWGFGMDVSFDLNFDFNLPKDLFTLLTEGNKNNQNAGGDIEVSGSGFFNIDIPIYVRIIDVPYVIKNPNYTPTGKLKLGFTPGIYYPLIYIPNSKLHYEVDTRKGVKALVDGALDVYTGFSLEEVLDGNAGAAVQSLQHGGFDISISGEYPLATFLDAGLAISHIPFVPARMNHKGHVSVEGTIIDEGNLISNLSDIEVSVPEISSPEDLSADEVVFRPMRFDFYALYRPVDTLFWGVTVKPNIGFTALTADEKGAFNISVIAQLGVIPMGRGYMIYTRLGTGYDERLWRHQVGFTLNLRAWELGLDFVSESQAFKDSFGKGMSLKASVLVFGF